MLRGVMTSILVFTSMFLLVQSGYYSTSSSDGVIDAAVTLTGIELFMYDTFGKGAVTVLVIFVAGLTGILFLLSCCWCCRCCCFRKPFQPQSTQIIVTQQQPGLIQSGGYTSSMQQPLIVG
ncbi:hypothetical protein ACHWQZ_G017984 [Mnemiopsis leidyi]